MLRSPLLALALALVACGGGETTAPSSSGGGGDLQQIMTARGLTDQDILAAAKTYTPSGKHDEYDIFASGGQAGDILVIGVPSMRILKYIAVFGPESWQGYGYGGLGNKILAEGAQRGQDIEWGDVHHPNLSETKGDYDGKYLFVNDKANARVAVVDLSDFMTKQIVTNPLVASDHGGAFVTPDTDYIVETSQYAAPLGGKYATLDKYNDEYRGAAVFWKFDKEKGRIDKDKSWAIELPPYMQDLADAGKLDSDGWVFINSWNTERATGTGGNPKGKYMESGASANDTDYLHIIDWKRAEALVAAGKTTTINGMRVLPLDLVAKEHVLVFAPEPKSPHGCDVTPDGKGIVVGGKLDTHTTVFEFSKIKDLIAKGDYAGVDAYGVSVLDFQKSIRGQQQLGLGPLHTVFDDKGLAYTSLFLDSMVAKWDPNHIGGPVETLPVQYNIGHITAAEGDTVSPDGHYVVAMNKMAQDRFNPVGPLLPQNFQLIDISGPKMQLLYDLPIPLGEPHYAQMIKADKLHPKDIYKPAGTNPYTDQVDPGATQAGKERIERNGKKVDVYMTEIRSHITPDYLPLEQGDDVTIHITSIEQAYDETHGFAIDMYNVNLSMEPGKYEEVHFIADKPGVFPYYCTEFCSALHLEMMGYMLVKPAGT